MNGFGAEEKVQGFLFTAVTESKRTLAPSLLRSGKVWNLRHPWRPSFLPPAGLYQGRIWLMRQQPSGLYQACKTWAIFVWVMTLFLALIFTSLAHATAPYEPIRWVDEEWQRRIVAEVVAAEAGGEGKIGMQAVCNVITNRARAWKKTPYEVITQPKQFFGLTSRNRTKLYRQVSPFVDELVRELYEGKLEDLTGGALYFENVRKWGKPRWARKMTVKAKVKNHVFF